jgi:MFS family permease
MLKLHDLVFDRWRAVPVLGVTQILAWGALFYPPVLMMPLIAAARGWSLTFAMGGFSGALLAAGLVAPVVGSTIDRLGGHWVMTVGSLLGALGLVLLVSVENPFAYLAVWALIGAAMAASLYDSAFATLGRIFGAAARSPITALTLAGGFASTVSWPATHYLIEACGWRGTYLVYAALLALVAAPLHAFALPRGRFDPMRHATPSAASAEPTIAPNGAVFVLLATGFAAYAFVPSGLGAHLLAMLQRFGIDPATAVGIGALFGPAQVGARLCEFIFARKVHPLDIGRFALAMMVAAFIMLGVLGFSTAVACIFAIAFGAANGLLTIARGAVPLALFGAKGYGRVLGRIAKPFLLVQSMAPLVLALVIERASDAAAFALTGLFAVTAFVCLIAIRRP